MSLGLRLRSAIRHRTALPLAVAAVYSLAFWAPSQAAAAGPAPASGNVGADAALREPARWTAGDSDQLLGSLTPDGRDFVYLSNRDAVASVWSSRVGDAAGRALFDEGADVSLPRVSPDGRWLLYLSSRDDATGDACLRAWPSMTERRCLGDGRTAESFAFFFPDGAHVGVVARAAMHGEMLLHKVPIDGSRKVADADIVLPRSVATPALSPDGRWLAYVAVERASTTVGVQFAMQLGAGLHLRRLEGKAAERVVRFDLPGATGFPAFSPDGKWLYFAQALGDSNGDQVIDGDDRSVLFRVAFDPRADPPLRSDNAVQLTSGATSCRYPAPGRDRLLFTCEVRGRLDVFALPLEGVVPSTWSESRLLLASDGATEAGTRALLAAHLQLRTHDPLARLHGWQRLAELAVQRDDLAAASFYLGRSQKVATPAGETETKDGEATDATAGNAAPAIRPGTDRSAARGVATALLEWVGHRAETLRLEHGARDETYASAQATRLKTLHDLLSAPAEDVTIAARLAIAAIEDALGREERAEAALGAIDPTVATSALAWRLLASLGVGRWLALQRDEVALRWMAALCDREDLEGAAARAAEAGADPYAIREAERLELADRFVQRLLRGKGAAARAAALAAWRGKAEGGSLIDGGLLALRLEVERALQPLAPPGGRVAGESVVADAALQEQVRAALFAIYGRERGLDRRRALVRATLERAAARDASHLLYQFATVWASFVPRGHPERALAIDVYRQVVLERAYTASAGGAFAESRGVLLGLTLIDDDPEAQLGWLFASLRERDGGANQGEPAGTLAAALASRARSGPHLDAVAAEVEARFAKQPNAPAAGLLRASLALRRVATTRDPDAQRGHLEAAEAALDAVAEAGGSGRHLHLLRGHVAHQRFLRGEGRSFAVQAHDRYRLALELSAEDLRLQGGIWHAIGLLQSAVGNHREALLAFDQRLRSPRADSAMEIGLWLSIARSRWHVAPPAIDGAASPHRESLAAVAAARRAVALCDAATATAGGEAEVARALLPWALDRLALLAFDAGLHAEALQAASRAMALGARGAAGPGAGEQAAIAEANRMRRSLLRAAAAVAIGQAEVALQALNAARASLARLKDDDLELGRRPSDPALRISRDHLLRLIDGLQGRALLAAGQARAALAPLQRRIASLTPSEDADPAHLTLAAAQWHLGLAQAELGDLRAAMQALGSGLRACRRFSAATGTVAPPERVYLVEAALALHLGRAAALDDLQGVLAAEAIDNARIDLASEAESVYRALCAHGHPRWAAARDRLQMALTLLACPRTGKGASPQ